MGEGYFEPGLFFFFVRWSLFFKCDMVLDFFLSPPPLWCQKDTIILEMSIIIYYFMLHPNRMYISDLDETPAKFQKDPRIIVELCLRDTQCQYALVEALAQKRRSSN